ncbi:ornithine cyclodeaminase family protein [Phycobacter sp. K97]|uniref:ornithine cyclodeaminase family protein n=1 Tax=Phycobacter sedimenti TaxID=3133977 RepID=UPI00311F00EB
MIKVYTSADIRPHLDIKSLIPSAKQAFHAIAQGKTTTPTQVMHPTGVSDIHLKSAVLAGCSIFTVKTAGWSQLLADRGEPPSSGMIVVFDSQTCRPLAILQDEHLISDYRTAAAGAIVAKFLVPSSAQSAVIVGTGTQARLQTEALLTVAPMSLVRVWGRDTSKVLRMISELKPRFPATRFAAAPDLERSVRAADVIIVATGAKKPLIQSAWLRPGQHVTSVGSDDATKCEIDPAALADAQVFVEARSSGEAFGTPRRAIASGLICASDLVELGTALETEMTPHPSCTSIACLSGLGVQDLTAVQAIWPALTAQAPLSP